MTLFEFLLLGFAVYYLAVAFVDMTASFVQWYLQRDVELTSEAQAQYLQQVQGARYEDVKFGWLLKWSQKKPMNCVLCMSFYVAAVLVPVSLFIPVWVISIPAIAGAALLLSKIHQRLETFI